MKFIPFHHARTLGRHQVVAVDCFLPGALNLSHWRGAGPPAHIATDTSTGIVLNALEQNALPPSACFVTNNHFDVDGFVGIWALLHPEKALAHRQLLECMALLGDFRELPADQAVLHQALKLVCWLNTMEKKFFYVPFGMANEEVEACVPKYAWFLERFEQVLNNPDLATEGQAEASQVQEHIALLQSSGSVHYHAAIRLLVVEAAQPLHYYALFGSSASADMVLTVYPGHHYELEYKYTTWIDAFGRAALPRIGFQPLVARLMQLEQSGLPWTGTKITDTGPILRLGPSIHDKAERFNHPFSRQFYSSTIPPHILKAEVAAFYKQAYESTAARETWTWDQVRKVNEDLQIKLKQ